jgi:hypothetical protein
MAIQLHLSGGTNNTDPKGALGGQRSSTQITSDSAQNLFDNITRTETLIGKIEYRCLYVYNPSGNPFTNCRVSITTHPGTSNVFIGSDPAGKGDGQSNGVATSIVTEDSVPTNVTFTGEDEDTFEVPCGLLNAGEGCPIWIKRTAEKGAAQTVTFTLKVEEDAGTLPSTSFADNIAYGEHRDINLTTGLATIDTNTIGFTHIQ